MGNSRSGASLYWARPNSWDFPPVPKAKISPARGIRVERFEGAQPRPWNSERDATRTGMCA